MEKEKKDIGWERECVNLRLTKGRRNSLVALAGDLPAGYTPTDAVDQAIAMALASRRTRGFETGQRFNDVDAALASLASDRRHDAAAHGNLLADVAKDLADLRALISAVATLPGQEDGSFDGDVPSLRDWLEKEACDFDKRSMLVKAQWRTKSRINDQLVSLELLLERLAVAGQTQNGKPGYPGLARIEGMDATNPITRIDLMSAFYLACQGADKGGWQVSAHQINLDRSIGAMIGSMRV